MIVATIVMLILTLATFPFVIRVKLDVNLDNLTCKLTANIGFVRVFAINLFIKGGKICYQGTINGCVDTKGSKAVMPICEIVEMKSVAVCHPTINGLQLLGFASVVSSAIYSILRQNGVKSTCKCVIGSFNGMVANAWCKVSIISLLGVDVL